MADRSCEVAWACSQRRKTRVEEQGTRPGAGAPQVASRNGDQVSKVGESWKRIRESLGSALAPLVNMLDGIGATVHLTLQTVLWTFRRPFRLGQMMSMMDFIGVRSLFIISLTGAFTGMVLALQTVNSLRRLQQESLVGGIVVVSLMREMSPVFAGLMVTARAGSAMAAELGNMRVTEQIDAITTMSVSPVQYLLSPRLLASVLMLPLLCIVFTVVGSLGGYVVAVEWLNVDPGAFIEKIRQFSTASDLWMGLIKAAVFGFLISSISCRQGYFASGGARGVGEATTRAVVQSAVAILISNYIITSLLTDGL
jgi:phospholipid/cholesterol/gamma-HCH transport system permease protein